MGLPKEKRKEKGTKCKTLLSSFEAKIGHFLQKVKGRNHNVFNRKRYSDFMPDERQNRFGFKTRLS
jgi:hypothetical protein